MTRIIFLLVVFLSISTHANEHIITPMIGSSSWSDSNGHVAEGNGISFEDKSETTYGFRYLYSLDNGFAFGGDIYTYEIDPNNPARANDASVGHFHAIAEYFLFPGNKINHLSARVLVLAL